MQYDTVCVSEFVSEFKWRWAAGEKSCGDVSHMLYYFISVNLESINIAQLHTWHNILISHSISVFVFEIWHSPEISACWLGAGACKRLSWWHLETGRWWWWWWWQTRPSRWTAAEQRRSTCPVCEGMAWRRGIKSIRLQLVKINKGLMILLLVLSNIQLISKWAIVSEAQPNIKHILTKIQSTLLLVMWDQIQCQRTNGYLQQINAIQ